MDLTITIHDAWAEFIQGPADHLHVDPPVIVERIIAGAMARRSAMQTLYPDEPAKAIMPELIIRDGRLWPEDASQLFAVLRELAMQAQSTPLDDNLVAGITPEGNA